MNHPFERILLATDHTEFDSGAERLAFDMAKRCGIPLAAVMPVVSNPEYEIIAPQLAQRAEQEAAARIDLLRRDATAAGVQLDVVARRGEEPYFEIVQEATERHSDLIVVRRRGKRSFLSNLMVGETVSKVVGHAPCNVLFVPRAAQMWTRGILAAVDLSLAAEHIARVAAAIAVQCDLPLSIISVASHDTPTQHTEAERVLAHATDIASAIGARVQNSLVTGKPFEQILAAAKALPADLIIVGRHGESNLIHTPFGGTTQKVVGLADTPVLVVRA